MNKRAKAFIALTTVFGALAMLLALSQWQSQDPIRFFAYLGITLIASGLTVALPGINGSMSVTFLFILLGILELTLAETMAIGCAATLLQCFTKMNRPTTGVRVLFNVCGMMAPAIWASHWIYHSSASLLNHSTPLMIMTAGATFFLTNTVPIACVLSLVEGKPFREIWAEFYFWSFPYYLAGGALVALIHFVNRFVGWQASLLVLPVVYWIFRSYRLYLGKLKDEKRHVEEMASLHLRTIEALALAIDAKDHTTHDHLQRVRIYAVEIASELGLDHAEIEALKAASLLHDIGKLAVPEHIISKPGKLTSEEFEKMKIHPVVGAEILKRVQFPYPVVPIVRAHHEKWDGSGYPDGLKGEEIPVAARILSVVDCLDALASDRQYRRAMPLDRAMEHVANLAGRDFDPKIVDILKRRYIELEQMAKTAPRCDELSLPTDIKIERGSAPAAGFQKESAASIVASPVEEADFLTSIAAARQEAQSLFEITHDLGKSLSLDETLSVVSIRLRKLVTYDSIAVWIRYGDVLIPKHVTGDNFRLFSSLEIPLGQGLSGWVAQNNKPIINGNPSVEPGYLNDPTKFSTLRAALSVPLEGVNGVIGAMTLYRTEADAFSRDNLRVALAISTKVALSIENAMRFQEAENSATTDYLTGLPNARSLFLHLDRELMRCQRTGSSLAVMVCDLNGFKLINDHHGHLQGNNVLRHFAQGLRDSCRDYDYVARMGGDEFVIVAPGLKREAAQEKTIRINELALEAARHVIGPETLTASVGTAFFGEQGDNVEQLLAEADRHMYLAKQSHYQPQTRRLNLIGKISAGGTRSTFN
jgi:diguanylate cyclase (GGDEF)-like protein/putative nucleotidyltransferase with HDIG domain